MYKTRISVIVPTYQPQGYIKECLAALDNQTLNKGQYEVIVILNGCNEPYKSNLHKIVDSMTCNVRLIHTMQGRCFECSQFGY